MSETEMLETARMQWPGIDKPDIVKVSSGIHSLIIPILSPEITVEPFRENDPLFLRIRDEWVSARQPITFAQVKIDLLPIGPFMMGYDPRTNILVWRPIDK